MARIPLKKALRWVMDLAPRLEPGQCLDLLCKKRNRLVRIVALDKGFRVEERGFFKEDHAVQGLKDLEKVVSRLISREFPRSHMLWAFKRRA